ncbi:MAG: hypothetical protein P4L92_08675 [Rudaea sp.]|nr:hypothetical protein [Rudaea sp.]
MLRSRLSLLLLLPVFLLLMAFRQVPLQNPDPIAVPAKVTNEQETKAIKAALLHRQWIIAAEKPGEVDGTLQQNEYTVRIAVSYDPQTIRIRYVDSVNLKYEKKKDGVEYIHKNYPGWIQDLARDIQSNLILFGS